METITLSSTKKQDFIDITSKIERIVADSKVKEGICIIYCPHTTAAITINENADPAVPADIKTILNHFVPTEKSYKHTEGYSAAHAKGSIIGCSETIIIKDSSLVLGTWQGIFFCDFDGPRSGRKVHVEIISK